MNPQAPQQPYTPGQPQGHVPDPYQQPYPQSQGGQFPQQPPAQAVPHPGYVPAPPLHTTTAGRATAKARLQHRELTPEEKSRHEESKRRYPRLTLSVGEYVIEEVRRHPIGIVSIWSVVALLAVLIFFALTWYSYSVPMIADIFSTTVEKLPTPPEMIIPALILMGLIGLGGFLATYVYNGNRFYLTNESVIQHVQTSIFDTKNQVVNLINVEDASSDQSGILQQVLNYGTLRLSTQGEETIYHFQFVANPGRVVHTINDATEKAVLKAQGVPVVEY